MFRNSFLMTDPTSDPSFPIPPTVPPRLGLIERFLTWLLKPVEFPGRWPADESPPERYNTEVPNESKLPHDS